MNKVEALQMSSQNSSYAELLYDSRLKIENINKFLDSWNILQQNHEEMKNIERVNSEGWFEPKDSLWDSKMILILITEHQKNTEEVLQSRE